MPTALVRSTNLAKCQTANAVSPICGEELRKGAAPARACGKTQGVFDSSDSNQIWGWNVVGCSVTTFVCSHHILWKFLVKSAEERLKPWTPAADQAPGAEPSLMGIRREVFSFFFKRGPVIYLMCSYVWKQASQQLRKWCTMLDLDMGRCGIHSDRWYTTKMAFISEFLMLQIISSSFCVVLLPFLKLGFTPEKLRFTPIQRCLYSHALISPPFSSSRPGVPRWDGCCSRGGLVDLHEAMDTTSAEARWGRCGDDFRPAEPWGFNQTTGGLVENHHF